MQKYNWEKMLNYYLSHEEDVKMNKSDLMLEICKKKFVSIYGKEILKFIEVDYKEDLLEEKFKIDESMDFLSLSEIYDHYLLSNKRMKTGSFYTPIFIIEYMVEKALVLHISKETDASEDAIKRIFSENQIIDKKIAKDILYALDGVKIIDIACGTGLFLIMAFKRIFEYKKKLYTILDKEENDFFVKKYIIENNIFGIDIQKNPIQIAKMSLASMVYEGGTESKEKIYLNLKVGNSLIDEDMIDEKFHIALGNPPYVGERGNKDMFDEIKNTPFGKKYYEGKMDYFYFFIYRALEILKEQGILGYITTNYFVTADGAEKLRKFLKDHTAFRDIINFNDYEIFKHAKGQHNIIFFLAKEIKEAQSVNIRYIKEKDMDMKEMYKLLRECKSVNGKIYKYQLQEQRNLYGANGHILIQENEKYENLLKKIEKNSQYKLKELCNVNQGVVSGADKVAQSMIDKGFLSENIEKNNIINQGIFVLTKEEASKLGFLELPYLKPMYKNSDIRRYGSNHNPSKFILYILNETFENIGTNSEVLAHLYKYKEVLNKRRETVRGTRAWYALQWPRKQEMFENMKIIVPHRAKRNTFAFNDVPWYASADVYFITSLENIDWYVLLGQLNSKIMYFWLYNRGKRKGEYLELYANPLKNLPILCNIDKNKKELSTFVKKMIKNGECHKIQNRIDNILYEEYKLTKEEIKIIEALYNRNF